MCSYASNIWINTKIIQILTIIPTQLRKNKTKNSMLDELEINEINIKKSDFYKKFFENILE